MTVQQELKDAIKENTAEIVAFRVIMAEHNAKQQSFEELVTKHEIALYGNPQQKGYLQRFDKIEERVYQTLGGIERGLWAVALAILGGLGFWIWEIVRLGLVK